MMTGTTLSASKRATVNSNALRRLRNHAGNWPSQMPSHRLSVEYPRLRGVAAAQDQSYVAHQMEQI